MQERILYRNWGCEAKPKVSQGLDSGPRLSLFGAARARYSARERRAGAGVEAVPTDAKVTSCGHGVTLVQLYGSNRRGPRLVVAVACRCAALSVSSIFYGSSILFLYSQDTRGGYGDQNDVWPRFLTDVVVDERVRIVPPTLSCEMCNCRFMLIEYMQLTQVAIEVIE